MDRKEELCQTIANISEMLKINKELSQPDQLLFFLKEVESQVKQMPFRTVGKSVKLSVKVLLQMILQGFPHFSDEEALRVLQMLHSQRREQIQKRILYDKDKARVQ